LLFKNKEKSMYTLSGCGYLGQAAGDGPKVITMDQVARELIKDLLDFSIPVVGIKLGNMVPDSIESVLVNITAAALQGEFAEALDVTKDEAHTDMVGFKLAGEVCEQMYNYGVGFTDDPEDTLWYKNDGLVWIGMVGSSWKDPGELAKFISNKLEDIVTELTGVEAEAPPDDWFGDRRPISTIVMEEMGPPDITGRVEMAPQIFAPVPKPSELPVVPLAIAGIAALLLLG
jgi:hypothetical protein